MTLLPLSTAGPAARIGLVRSLILGLTFAGAAFTAGAQILSVNISAPSGTGNSVIPGTFGISSLGTEVGNWNNVSADVSNLIWDDGSSSTVDFAYSNPEGNQFFGAPYANTPVNYGAKNDTTTPDTPGTSLTLSNLNLNFPNGYWAIAYLSGFTGNTGASITDGSSTYYFQTNDTQALILADGPTTTTVDPGDGNAPEAQYAVFGTALAPFSDDSKTFTLDALYGGGAGLGGVQLVAVVIPEPGLLTVLMSLMVGVMVLARRQRG